jgi:CheY-like chemotaxis protein
LSEGTKAVRTIQPTHQRTVLIVDDSSDIRAFFEAIAGIHGIPLLTATDGVEGLRSIETLGHDPAVVFVDLNMPNMGGVEFLEQLRSRGLCAASRVVVCSGGEPYAFQKSDRRFEWLQKPFEMSRVLSIISQARLH